ncbi:MAG: UDP-3-O-acylglucosamine N-acyltransferase [Phycisphaerae bacterium]|jgi:UDP-3-O-[3-hydroxymyristoyl] glucosamine N-acyltransferase|nr:MAG: UDP-3-O-acylglucosamine N-acyltransferase [Phycisphaerae bacterium]
MPTLKQLADLLGVPCPVGGHLELRGIQSLEDAGPSDLSILARDAFVKQYQQTRAGAVLVGKKVRFTPRTDVPTLIVEDPDLALIRLIELLAPSIPQPEPGISPRAIIDPTARIGSGAAISPGVVIGKRTVIGENARIHPGVIISDDVVIGDDVILYPNVVIRERITIGNRVIINAGSVIGTDGFGYRWDGQKQAKIPQIGTVVIEDDVEIGSCTCIDRAKFNETRIGKGTKIDNLVQIGHNVRIGMHSIICGQVGIAGSAQIGNFVVLGGASAVRDHVRIADGVMAGGHAVVVKDISPKQAVSGLPALPHRQTLREQAAIRRLPELLVQIRKLQEEVDQLKTRLEQSG